MIDEPRCAERRCVHFRMRDEEEADDKPTPQVALVCAAFPNGIPDRILLGEDLHVVKADDQVGDTVFEAFTGPASEYSYTDE